MRKMVHIETNLSNKLREEHDELFSSYGCRLPKKFKVPPKQLRPIAIHFFDGQLMILWAAVDTEFTKWLNAFNQLKIEALHPEEQRH